MDMIPSEVAIVIRLGIGDLVFIEPGVRLLLENGVAKVHLFCRPDGMNIYHAYPGVQTHSLEELKRYKAPANMPIIRIDEETHKDIGYRTELFAKTIVCHSGMDISIPERLVPHLPVADIHVDWAEIYLKPQEGQNIILWQMESSRESKSLPRESSIAAIQLLLDGGEKVVVLTNNHRGFPRHHNLKLLRGIPIERFMGICKHVTTLVGLDSAPSWIAGAVGTETIAIFGPTDPALYCPHTDNIHAMVWNSTCGLQPCGVVKPACAHHSCLNIPPEKLVDAIMTNGDVNDDILEKSVSLPPAWVDTESILYIRIIGIGDIFLSLPAIVTIMCLQENRECRHVYMTGKAGKIILEGMGLFDEVIEVKYNHPTSGHVPKPPGEDYEQYETIYNMINAVDFHQQSDNIPRTELFGRLLGVDEIDYTLPGWKLSIPTEWKRTAAELLSHHGIGKDDRTIALQVDTKGESRVWPITRQKEFCNMAIQEGFKVILLSDIYHSEFPDQCINLTGATTVAEYISVIEAATICVAADSSMVHIAGALDKRCVGLFGAINPELRIAHYSTIYPMIGHSEFCIKNGEHQFCNDWQQRCCIDKTLVPECMWSIQAVDVWSKIKEVLDMEVCDEDNVYTSQE